VEDGEVSGGASDSRNELTSTRRVGDGVDDSLCARLGTGRALDWSDAALRLFLRALAPPADTDFLRPLAPCTGPAPAGHPLTWNAKEPP
jgi:hypothetical protein